MLFPAFITLAAVIFQVFRNATSKELGRELSPVAVSLARFLPGIPFVAGFLALWLPSHPVQIVSPWFFFWACSMGLFQLVANTLLVRLFQFKNFALSVALSKTEMVFIALFGVVLVGEPLGLLQSLALVLVTLGVMGSAMDWSELRPKALVLSLVSKASVYGLGVGLSFGLSAPLLKLAYRELTTGEALTSGMVSLLVVLVSQSALLSAVLTWRSRAEWRKLVAQGPRVLRVAALSVAGSACWFWAFALAPLAFVRTVGQAEILVTAVVGALVFHERLGRAEVWSLVLVVVGTVLMVLPLGA